MPGEALTTEEGVVPPAPAPVREWTRGNWPGSEWRRLVQTARPLPLLLAVAWVVHREDRLPAHVVQQTQREQAIVEALFAHALNVRLDDIHFVSPTRPLLDSPVQRERALVRAAHPGEPHDIYLVDVRRSPEGHLIAVSGLYNLTDTSAADEQKLVVDRDRAAWVITQEGAISSVQYADLRGEPPPRGPAWTRLALLQNALTNYQESGQFGGIGRRSFKLEPPAYRVALGLTDTALFIDADAHKIRIPTGSGPIEGEQWVRDLTPQKARPGNLVTWAVDRVRALPWFGDEGLALMKAVAFQGKDQLDQIVSTVTGDDGSETVAEELGRLYSGANEDAMDPETGWPPPPMEPMFNPPLKGEGKWVTLTGFPFVLSNPGAPSPFVFSFIRTDKKRIYSQVFVTLWDPRQVELDAVSGTVEPRSATGATGAGMVPREPRVLSRFVAAFNGGFQAVHGEFGMMANRVVYLPPKPFGATVAKLEGGATAFGTWPEAAEIPADVVSYRQNMNPLVVDDELNPYKRHWWGGVPPGWTEESRTVRSGLCMTRDGFVGYFYGLSVDHEVLGLAMQRARCTYGIHLDMNAGHTGLEFYRVGQKGTLPSANRRLEDVWEAQGTLPDLPGWEFKARRMIKYMALMNFPRYVNTESRDFFYLTLRHLLPGDPVPATLSPAEEGEGTWRTHGLPQRGWPYAVATTNLRPDADRPYTRVGLIKLDPKFLRPEQAGDAASQRILEFRSAIEEGALALWHSEARGFAIAENRPERGALISAGTAPGTPDASRAQAALGIDAAGMLIYARVTEGPEPGKDAALLVSLLQRLQCEQILLVPRPMGATFAEQGEGTPNAAPALTPAPGTTHVSLVRAGGPAARRIFPETPVVGPKHWAPLQQKRVRTNK